MGNNDENTSDIAANLPGQPPPKKPKLTSKQLAGIIGGVALAVAVAWGGETFLSQFPNTVAQTAPYQTSPANPPASSTVVIPPASNGPVAAPITNTNNDSNAAILPGNNDVPRDVTDQFRRHR